MILNLYSLKNRLSGIYERPFAEIYDDREYPELLRQSLSLASVDELNRHKEYDLYSLGTFDSISGVIKCKDPDFVISLESICLSYLAVKESKNVQESA